MFHADENKREIIHENYSYFFSRWKKKIQIWKVLKTKKSIL